jgi:secreted trypsin-like serine protease
VCAWGSPGWVSGCYGDGGNPLAHWDGTRWIASGISSLLFGNCQSPNVYTRLSDYSYWIQAWMRFKTLQPSQLDMRCYRMSSITGCEIDGPYELVSPLQFTWSASGGGMNVVYPSYGTFPYSTSNGVIFFGQQSSGTMLPCPSGTSITMSASFYGNSIGSVTRSCP